MFSLSQGCGIFHKIHGGIDMSIKINRNILALFDMRYSTSAPTTPKELIARMRRQVASMDRAVLNGIDTLRIAQP